jgi:hypothetical protein
MTVPIAIGLAHRVLVRIAAADVVSVAVRGAAMSHVFTRGGRVWAVRHGIVHADATTIEILRQQDLGINTEERGK